MNTMEELVTFLDLLDLDEELIDSRLKSLMERSNYSNQHLKNAIQLLKYKHLINMQENTDCENDVECNFVAKLLQTVNDENIEYVCKIISIVLQLHTDSIVSKAEHLLQQMLSNMNLPFEHSEVQNGQSVHMNLLLSLKICDSILDIVIRNNKKISLMFLETPLENILLRSVDEKIKIYFLTNIVPKLFEGTVGYNILDRIWNYLIKLKDGDTENVLKTLSCLSNYYLPTADDEGNVKFESEIVFNFEFWNIILLGLRSIDPSTRRMSVYLAKRAIDNVRAIKADISVKSSDSNLFVWEHKHNKTLKTKWDNFFILLESLEEKQSNIVLPSVQLFEQLRDFEKCWLDCAFILGLKHENTHVRLKCIEHRLNFKLNDEQEAAMLLEALNDINIYDVPKTCETLKQRINIMLNDTLCLVNVLKAMPTVKWSPVPLYHISEILHDVNTEVVFQKTHHDDVSVIIKDILKIPCNNVQIRKAVQVNISHFVGNCFRSLDWRACANVYPLFHFESMQEGVKDDNPFILYIQRLELNIEEKHELFKLISESHTNIDFGLLYLDNHEDDGNLFLDILQEKIKSIEDIVNRQYCNKMKCIIDVVFLVHLYAKTSGNRNEQRTTINTMIARQYKTVLQYISSLLSNEKLLEIENMHLLFKRHKFEFAFPDEDLGNFLLQLYKTSILVLKDKNIVLDRRVTAVLIVNNLIIDNINNNLVLQNNRHEILNVETVVGLIKDFGEIQKTQSTGRLKNIFYEELCETVTKLLTEKSEDIEHINVIVDFIDAVTECGGYGCLLWILKIMNQILTTLLKEDKQNFNVGLFLNRMWKEIEELKTNSQYVPCIEEFVKILTTNALLEKSAYNNVVVHYCNKITEYGILKNTALYYLVKELNNKSKWTSQMVFVLCDVLLYCPVPRKDQRVTENIEIDIQNNPKYGVNKLRYSLHHNYQIHYLAVATLCKIQDRETLDIILLFITNKVNELLKNKTRYHGNSQSHRILLTAVQHMLVILLLNGETCNHVLDWCLDTLGRLPHQPNVRICLEWYIALYFYIEKTILNEEILQTLKSKNIPLTSQFFIVYWLMKHKLHTKTHKIEEFDFVMDYFLSHTMGQLFNIRLHAQYLAAKLYKLNKNHTDKYAYTIEIVERTFDEGAHDKNFLKLQEDYFANDFDVVSNLTPYFIYKMLPKYTESYSEEKQDMDFVKCVIRDVDAKVRALNDNEFKREWSLRVQYFDDCHFNLNSSREKRIEDSVEAVGTIQKKYIPWKNMSDVNVYDVEKKQESRSELIVVASLIDKLPNLGGMARTSEVFGVRTYVVDSLRHLQDKQFQGLSVSAERWIDVEEVRPGRPLKEYLTRKKAEGYSVVAAEQTSTSCKLQAFKFPRKTLLLLGHEKEGIPCDLLPMMDHCVEIPQQGVVRSLNVHVTAAIFVWEYARQNIL